MAQEVAAEFEVGVVETCEDSTDGGAAGSFRSQDGVGALDDVADRSVQRGVVADPAASRGSAPRNTGK